MFEFLQQEMRKPEVKSMDEMIAKNFTFYMHKGYVSRDVKNEFGKRFDKFKCSSSSTLIIFYMLRFFTNEFYVMKDV